MLQPLAGLNSPLVQPELQEDEHPGGSASAFATNPAFTLAFMVEYR